MEEGCIFAFWLSSTYLTRCLYGLPPPLVLASVRVYNLCTKLLCCMWYYNILCHLLETVTSGNRRPLFTVNLEASMQFTLGFVSSGFYHPFVLYTICVCICVVLYLLGLTPFDVGSHLTANFKIYLSLE